MKKTILFFGALLYLCSKLNAQEFTTRTENGTFYLVRQNEEKDKEGRISRTETLFPFPDTATLTNYLIEQSRALLQRSAEHTAAAQLDADTAKKIMALAAKMPALPQKQTPSTAATPKK